MLNVPLASQIIRLIEPLRNKKNTLQPFLVFVGSANVRFYVLSSCYDFSVIKQVT